MTHPLVTCLDMEGVVAPEIWLAVADHFNVQDLKMTTRDIPDYDELMQKRLLVLREHGITLEQIKRIVEGLSPLEGAVPFLAWLRERCQVIILSDTYYEFVSPLMKQLNYPTIFCHSLEVDEQGFISHYHLRMPDQKRHAVQALKNIGFRVIAAGDSYNDISMLKEADAGIFFCPPESIKDEFPQFPVTRTYEEFQARLAHAGGFAV
ncbi:MAG: phosphoserine phosphatase ThrH [Nitrospirales bacterium]|nr:MAG: phosphoserine phosphatase ThrH [Nitrospirales bacterium]